MAFFITRKQSFLLGLGLLGTFFLISGSIIYSRNKARIPTATLSRESVEGIATPIPKSQPQEAVETPEAGGLGFVLNEFHRSLVKDGKIVWEVFGKRGQYNPGSSVASIQEPVLKLYDDKYGNIQVSARRADLSMSTTELNGAELFDKVVITSKNETTIKTNRAIYDRKAKTVEVPTPFELDNPGFRLLGTRLHATIDSQEIRITGGVQTTLKPKAGRKK